MTDAKTDRRGFLGMGALAPLMAGAGAASAGTGGADLPPARLSLNENAFGPSPRVVTAIAAQFADLARYADQGDADRLTGKIAAIEGVAPDQIVLGDILEALGRHLAGQAPAGGRFVLSVPGYPALVDAARPFGGEGVGVPLGAGLGDDLHALSGAIDARTRALFLVHPHNPSGTVHPDGVLTAFLRAASARTLVIVDEAYIEYHDPAVTAVRLTREGANVAVFRTFDKIHGLAALPFGYAVVPRALGAALHNAGVGGSHTLSRMALAAAEASLSDPAWIDDVRRRTVAGRDRLHATLDALGLEHTASHANFVFFRVAIPGDQARDRLGAAGIGIGRAFPPLDQWVRTTVGTEAEVSRTIEALKTVFGPSRNSER